MNKTYLVGYYGMQNSGDDALLLATALGAREFLGDQQFVVNSPRTLSMHELGTTSATLCEAQRFPAQNRLRQYRCAAGSERIIFGGGSVFHNARDINLKRHLLKLAGAREHLALGVGLGPFVNVRAEQACARFLNECHYVGVRDAESKAIAEAIAPRARVELTFDLAPSLLHLASHTPQTLVRQGIAVCLCPTERLVGDPEKERRRLAVLAHALDLAHVLTGEAIHFIDFNGHTQLGDRQVHYELASLMDTKTPKHFVEYDAHPLRVMQRMAGFKVALCMRLHASVLAFMCNTPVLSLNYHPKCAGWCEQIGMPSAYRVNINDLYPYSLAHLLSEGVQQGFEMPAMPVQQAANLSVNNWRNSDVYRQTYSKCDYSFV